MEKKSHLFNAIEKSHLQIVEGSNNLELRIKFAKNYVANEDLDKWAFSKLIATENFNIKYGSQAKRYFYNYGFINILDIKDLKFKSEVIKEFLKWSKKIAYFDINKKFVIDQDNKKRFELLVHMDQIPKKIIVDEKLISKNFEEFLEGFKTEIIAEITYRDQKLIRKAKEELGTTCCICNFNFEEKYGFHGKGFIEMHHLKPFSKGERISKIEDLKPVCSNCHRMLHKGQVTFTVDDIKEMIRKNI